MSKRVSPESLPELLRSAREEAGLTTGELADRLNVSRQSVWSAESVSAGYGETLCVRGLRELGYEVEGPVYHITEPTPTK